MIQQVLDHIKKAAKATWQFFASVVVVVIMFASNFHDLKSPNIILEVTAVNTSSSQPLDLIKHPELSSLKEIITESSDFIIPRSSEKEYSPAEIERTLLQYKNKISDIEKDISKTEKILLNITSSTNKKDNEDYITSLLEESSDLYLSLALIDDNTFNDRPKTSKTSFITEKFKNNLASKQKSMKLMLAKHQEASKQWENYKSGDMQNRTKLVITCAIGNQGSGATSLKPQALFRANLGEGNYLDFPLKMSGYDNSPEAASLQPHSYKVVKFESEEIQSMTTADRERFKSFLGNASPARLFISDVQSAVYTSNSVPFSPGVYEQKMFDALKRFASTTITN